VPIASTQEQQALQASLRDWAKRSAPLAVVRAMEPQGGYGGTGSPPVIGGGLGGVVPPRQYWPIWPTSACSPCPRTAAP